ncbi:MAG: 1-(5-phosphoribosyl)-5-[(5-phosphoribosylamino)methylideneamino]imidazole-4-carboxamide isomerase [Ruminococcaceae bacterium]|nr:1-(5-phosphoribosyl)-5-[(5-phosphoribosylamino)methylideneamino]imidazole-4-carboxamide isomerase [Oscillospiraceae bacterium]
MELFPAIDLYEGKAVRLYKGDYNNMTVYSENPIEIARDFVECGAKNIHIVDLEGARDGTTPNLPIVEQIARETPLFTEIGGGIRSLDTVRTYIEAGVDRVILGTAAVTDRDFLLAALDRYGDKIAVGVDIKDGYVAIKGWLEKSRYTCFDFCQQMQDIGVRTIICTDISKDGAMQGTNVELYRQLNGQFHIAFTASGGVSGLEDIVALRDMGMSAAIIGKAYYIGAIDLREALEVAK